MSDPISETMFGAPKTVTLADCTFYHVMDLPGHGTTEGQWDLRPGVDAYLGGVDFRGQRVLEIGPASGYLTIEMEQRGADVVAVEVPDDHGWDFVPFARPAVVTTAPEHREHMERVKNSWWFVRELYRSSAEMYYGDAAHLPEGLGTFDVALLGSVLTHTRDPLAILESVAGRSQTVIITEPYYADLDGSPICRLNPSVENQDHKTWWHFSPALFVHLLRVMGFESVTVRHHTQLYVGTAVPLFTVVARRTGPQQPN